MLNQTLADFITKGPTEAELVAAKKNITGGFAMRFDTNKELAGYVAMIGFYDMLWITWIPFNKKLSK